MLPGKPAGFLPVKGSAHHGTQEKIAQVWQQGEIVRGGKAIGGKAKNGEPREGEAPGAQIEPGNNHPDSQNRQKPVAALPEQGPEHHAQPQTVKNSKIDDDVLSRCSQQIHTHRGGGAQKAAEENLKPPLDAVGAQGDADAGNQQEETTIIVLKQQIAHWLLPMPDTEQVNKIVNEVDADHAQQCKPPKGIQLPYPLFHCAAVAALASSSSTR